MTEHHDPEQELHGLKVHLANLREDLHHVVAGAATTVRHYGHWDRETAREMMEHLDARLGRTIATLEARMEVVAPGERARYQEAVARLAALKDELETRYGPMGEGTADHATIHAVGEFHDRVDEHLEFLRATGREW